MIEIPSTYFLVVSAFLLIIGLAIILTKRNVIFVLMGIELILNAANLNFAVFSRSDAQLTGELVAVCTVALAAAEITIALAVVLLVVRRFKASNLDELSNLEY